MQNNNRTVKKYFKKPEYSKKYVFLAECIENAVLRKKNTVSKIKENETEKLNKLHKTYYAEVKKQKNKTKNGDDHKP